MAYGNFKELARKTTLDKFLRDTKPLKLQAIQNMMDIKEALLLWFINFLIKNPQVFVLNLRMNFINQLLKNLRKGKVY